MKRALLIVWLVLGASSANAQEQENVEALRAAWREALELDGPAKVVRASEEAFAADESLTRDGELVALRARALAAGGRETEARALLEDSLREGLEDSLREGLEDSPRAGSDATRPALELELARLDLDADRLDAVLERLLDEEGPRFADRPSTWWLVGKALARRGEAAAARPYLEHFVSTWRLDPEAPAAWHLLAQEALARRDLEAARTLRDRGRELSTWHGYYRTRRLQVRAAPDEPLPRLGLAQLWISVAEWERARDELRELTRRAPDFASGWAHLGEAERVLDREDLALTAYARALELDPDHDDARFNRARLHLARGETDAARADLIELTSGESGANPRYTRAHLDLARLLLAEGDEAAARRRYESYRELGGEEALEMR